jgi:hypothetical protein
LDSLGEPSDADYFSNLPRNLAEFVQRVDCPTEMKELFTHEHRTKFGGKERIVRMPRPTRIFDSRILESVGDVIQVSRQKIEKSKWLFDVTSIREDGISNFKAAISSIPPIRERMKLLKEGKRHSSRYSFRPYPLVTRLWLENEMSAFVPADLKSFLIGAIDYLSEDEWRTSIILSAIAVESELADMYEESYKSQAPDVPLGDLFHKVKENVSFPEEIALAIETTNRARIAAVHRSRLPVSQRDAINGLYGAVNFTQWHLFEHS